MKCAELTNAIRSALSGSRADESDFDSILSTRKPREELAIPDVELEEEEGRGEEGGKMVNEPKLQVVHLVGDPTAAVLVIPAPFVLVSAE